MTALRLLSFSLIVVLSLCNGCKDDPEPIPEIAKLPQATQSGARTFGCLVDGKAMVVTGYFPLFSMYVDGVLNIDADETSRQGGRSIGIGLSDHDLQPGTYRLTQFPEGRAVFYDDKADCGYETDGEVNGTLTITYFDRTIIAGTFQFEALSPRCNKVVRITEGRFDIKFGP